MYIINRKIRVNGIWDISRLKIDGKCKFVHFSGNYYRFVFVEDGEAKIGDIKLKAGEATICIGGNEDVIMGTNAEIVVMALDISGSSIPEIISKKIRLNAHMIYKLDRVFEPFGGNEKIGIDNIGTAVLHEIANNLEIFFINILDFAEKISNRGAGEYKEIIDIMRENVEKPLSVDDIATLCGMSTSNLKRIFSKYSSCSVHKYFLKMKVFRAIELLGSNYNVSEISETLSFNNQNYFGIVFKKETGFSPLNYKKKFLHKN